MKTAVFYKRLQEKKRQGKVCCQKNDIVFLNPTKNERAVIIKAGKETRKKFYFFEPYIAKYIRGI
jgi:hypothetical protein